MPSFEAILPHMNKPKPLDPAGKTTGFPYETLWEELDLAWEDSALSSEDLGLMRTRVELIRMSGAPSHLCVSQDQIEQLLGPLDIDQETREQLALHLFHLAAKYLVPEHRTYLQTSPNDACKQLATLSKAANALNDALVKLSPEASTLLTLFRWTSPDALQPRKMFNLGALETETHDLALTAERVANDIPTKTRGGYVDSNSDRWIWCSTQAIEHWTGRTVKARQRDREGSNPRLDGAEGDVLLSYLRLISPQIRIRTIVRIITKRRLNLKREPAS